MKPLAPIAAALLSALAIAIPGCGGGSSSGLGDSLGYMPADAPFVMTVDTDPDGDQWQNVSDMLGKFPGSGALKAQLEQAVKDGSDGKATYEDDVKPLLGNDIVLSVPTAEAFQEEDPPFLLAWKVEDEGKARDLIERQGKKVGEVEGAGVYSGGDGESFTALDDGTFVAARDRAGLEAALKRRADDAGMTTTDFGSLTAGVGGDALVRIGVNAQDLLAASPDAANARQVPWLAELRNVGVAISAEDDGVAYDFKATTAEGLTDADLPLAAGADAPQVVRRAGEIGFGLRNAAQTVRFGEAAARATDPSGFADYMKEKRRLGAVLGIDVDRDVIDQFDGDATVSVGLDGSFAFRSAVKDPAAMRKTLADAAPRLKRLEPGSRIGLATPSGNGEGLYSVAEPGGKQLVFGLVGDNFVAATDAQRAAQVAAQSPSDVPGARGAFAMILDARAVANAALARQGQGTAAQFLTGALGDYSGWVEAETAGLTGHFKLTIK